MKFDVVIGNPPYNSESGASSTIWDKFVPLCVKLTKENGYISLIHPPAWRKPNHHLRKTLTQDTQMIYLSINGEAEGMRIFNAGTRFDYYILQNKKAHTTTTVNCELNTISEINLTKLPFLPSTATSIMTKIIKGDRKIDAIKTSQHHTQRKHIHDNENKKAIYPQLHGTSITGELKLKYSEIKHHDQNTKKVIFGDGRHILAIYDNGHYGLTQHGIYVKVCTEQEGKNLVKFINSKLIQFIIKYTKWGNFQTEWQMFRYIDWPFANANEVTDEIIYDHFGLTQEERDYIEAYFNTKR